MSSSRRTPCLYPLAPSGLERQVPSLRSEALRLADVAARTGRDADARLAQAVAAEADLSDHVRAWRRPEVDGDAGPFGPGRGAVVAGTISTMTYSARRDDWIPTVDRVVHRALTPTLKSLPVRAQLAASEYEALVARRGAVRGIDLQGASGGSGISDGGAAARWEDDAVLTAAERAIGTDLALKVVRQARTDMDRRVRRSITVRVLTDRVCLSGRSLEWVLETHGWSRKLEHRRQLKDALISALGRVADVVGKTGLT